MQKGEICMKKKVIIGLCILLAFVLLLPIPRHLKDGGTVEYNAILYSVQTVHTLNFDLESEQTYLEGTIIEVLGIEIFNNVK